MLENLGNPTSLHHVTTHVGTSRKIVRRTLKLIAGEIAYVGIKFSVHRIASPRAACESASKHAKASRWIIKLVSAEEIITCTDSHRRRRSRNVRIGRCSAGIEALKAIDASIDDRA